MALAIALVIKTFVVQPFFIPSSSMENTLLIGDKVLVNKLVYHFRSIEPGDIIVFNGVGSWNPAPAPAKPASDPLVRAYDATLQPLFHSIAGLFGTPVGQTDYIKRVIGVPGDHVVCCNCAGPGHGQRRAAARVVLPVSGRGAVDDPLQHHRAARAAVGHGRQPGDVRRFAAAADRSGRTARSRRTR